MQAAIQSVIERKDLCKGDMIDVMRLIMRGEATSAQIGGFLIGLQMKGETITEIAAAAEVMRELVTPVEINVPYLVDTCGTGGDGTSTFNISTCCAFVVAAAGGKVAKHGNRSISSSSGSADVLEAAGAELALSPDQVAQCINEVGVGFMFAPQHHGAMKHAIGPRREMGVRTVFNLLGPLTNPAGAPCQVMGVFSKEWVEPAAAVLKQLGSQHVMVVHAEDGLDEISIESPTFVAELKAGEITTYTLTPEEFGFERSLISSLAVDSSEQSLKVIQSVFDGEAGSAHDIVALNAGAAIYVAGLVDSLAAGVDKAREMIASGAAKAQLDAYVRMTQSF